MGSCRPPSLYQRPPRPPPPRCYNCGEIGELACYQCSIYLLAHGFERPLSKDAIKKRRARALREERLRNPPVVSNVPSTSVPAPSPPRQCSNCLTKTTRDWVRSRLNLDWIVCTACTRYESKYGRHRPLSLEIKRSLKLVKQRELKKTLE
ncbi:hypothetical protein C8R46DRAFT_81358 [Mycena filopes]|nr:hypothetical protein C8R46DRAFT_81358 [Mycena filopes]